MYLSLFTLSLLGVTALAGPILTDSPAVLLGRELPKLKPAPICATKTLYGPYTLKYPIAGYDQSESFYAEKLSDGTFVISIHGSHDLPLGIEYDDGLNVGVGKDGNGIDYVATKIITESWGTKTYAFTVGGTKGALPTSCATTVTVKKGELGFPTYAPILPKPVEGGWPSVPKITGKY